MKETQHERKQIVLELYEILIDQKSELMLNGLYQIIFNEGRRELYLVI